MGFLNEGREGMRGTALYQYAMAKEQDVLARNGFSRESTQLGAGDLKVHIA